MATKDKKLSPEITLTDKAAKAYVVQSKKPLTATQKKVIKESPGVYSFYTSRWDKKIKST